VVLFNIDFTDVLSNTSSASEQGQERTLFALRELDYFIAVVAKDGFDCGGGAVTSANPYDLWRVTV
jgi:hypothetical protein